MRIAVSCDKESGRVSPHFGLTEAFKLYDAENGVVARSLVVAAADTGHDALAELLARMRVNVLICGAIGGGARAALEEAGVLLYGGVAGDADTAVNAFLAGTLGYDPDVHCRHHDCGEGRDCAGHDCRGCGHICS